MKFDKQFIRTRFAIMYYIIAAIAVYILWVMVDTAIFKGETWKEVGKISEVDSVELTPARGNILSSEEQLMASSLPNYKLYVDFLSGVTKGDTAAERKRRELFLESLDTISLRMSEICPIKSSQEYYAYLKKGLDRGSRHYELCPGQVSNYIQYNEIKTLPIFCRNKYESGLIAELRNGRKKPFGSLARRTLGEMYGAKDSARSGIELAYDSLLRGKPGLVHRKKVLSKFVDIVDVPAQDGYDIVTTLDVNMQDICENALREKMRELRANMGVVILMEVKTGDIKSIVNLELSTSDSCYYESRNYALASLMEPGSTFKTASIMVGIDDGYITKNDMVDTGDGVEMMYGSRMTDHNWKKGGYHMLDLPHILMVSSNIGVSKLIDKYYHSRPEKFVEGLRRVGIGTPLHLPFVGSADPIIRYPAKDRSNWSNTTIPWMSIGYETQIPPISTVTFYNAIANDGKMVKPRFVRALSKNGIIVENFQTEVIKKQICKPSTLKDIQEMLQRVVCDKDGLGKPAGNPEFHVSGKTGTAQISAKGGYGKEHLVSFCGYFPSENPKYTCIVAIRHNFIVASGGGQAGVVFSKISQRVLSKHVTRELICAADSDVQLIPDVKSGWAPATMKALSFLGVKAMEEKHNDWCQVDLRKESVRLSGRAMYEKSVPNVIGMGARDAVFALESRGLSVRLQGRGKVRSQSISAGHAINKGDVIQLILN